MKHTPGPWTVQRFGDGRTSAHEISSDAFIVATTAPCEMTDREAMETDAADARLIAAAPDLLAALREMLVWSQCRCIPNHEAGSHLCACGACGVAKVAIAAIAKAEGRA